MKNEPHLIKLIGLTWLMLVSSAFAHDGPTPLLHWSFQEKFFNNSRLEAQRGPAMPFGQAVPKATPHGLVLIDLKNTPAVAAEKKFLPQKDFTITSWCSVNKPTTYGGLVCALEDNGDAEKGWILGYDASHFYIGVATKKVDDGNGRITYLRSKTNYEVGKIYHLAATYDGKTLSLYLNGKLENSTTDVGGEILYAEGTQLAVAGYRDRNEDFPHVGQLISVQVYDQAAKSIWVSREFAHNAKLAQEAPADISQWEPLTYVVAPYLQYGTRTGMTVMWETNHPTDGILHYGETVECKQQQPVSKGKTLHEVRIENLKPGTQYFYKTTSRVASNTNSVVESEPGTFQTDAGPSTPFAFAVISDTQGNPRVSGTFAKMAWSHRPNFLLHPGDLVETGEYKGHWVNHFFASMNPLVSRVPFFPVLGNHEHNAGNYYRYVSLPDPEYYYTFSYGNAQFFMLDTNKKCDPSSEQYQWLDRMLAKSEARWKIVCHHQPPYSSDDDDFGNLWKTNKSTQGSLNARHLTTLYDKYHVDIVWNGHIHSYERTWPIRAGKPVEKGGPVYMITGGGGGPLETPGPFRTPFSNLVRRGHHYAMVWVNGGRLEYKAYDLEGRLFDTFTMTK